MLRPGLKASLPNGGEVEAYTYLCQTFLPKLVAAGVDEVIVRRLTVDNHFGVFAPWHPSAIIGVGEGRRSMERGRKIGEPVLEKRARGGVC